MCYHQETIMYNVFLVRQAKPLIGILIMGMFLQIHNKDMRTHTDTHTYTHTHTHTHKHSLQKDEIKNDDAIIFLSSLI